MRTLKFIVDGLIIGKDPNCDFDNLVPGTEGYLEAEFEFSDEWNGSIKIAAFRSNKYEHNPQILKDGKSCVIPASVLARNVFEIYIVGKKEDTKLITNKIKIIQNGGK